MTAGEGFNDRTAAGPTPWLLPLASQVTDTLLVDSTQGLGKSQVPEGSSGISQLCVCEAHGDGSLLQKENVEQRLRNMGQRFLISKVRCSGH